MPGWQPAPYVEGDPEDVGVDGKPSVERNAEVRSISFSPEFFEGFRSGLVSALMVGVFLLAVAYGARARKRGNGGG